MAQYTRLEVLQRCLDAVAIPVFYQGHPETAIQVVEACARGGATVVEFTHRADFAQDTFAQMVRHCREHVPQVVLGVGSIVEEGTAALYINLGANFVVSPAFNPAVARLCNRRKVAYMPGCGSVTEISLAEEFGVEICKLFPGSSVGGPEFVQAVKGPMPWSRLMPTGGVDNTYESISAWLGAGAACVGMGSKLIPSRIDAEALAHIESSCRQAMGYIKQFRESAGKKKTA